MWKLVVLAQSEPVDLWEFIYSCIFYETSHLRLFLSSSLLCICLGLLCPVELSLQSTVGPQKTLMQNRVGFLILLGKDEGWASYPIIENDEKYF